MTLKSISIFTRKIFSNSLSYNLDSKMRRHRPDYQIVLFMGLLMLLGLIIMYAIGPQRANVLNNAYGSNYSESYFFNKQVISLLVAVAFFSFMSLIPVKFLFSKSGFVLVLAIAACLILAIAGFFNLGIAQKSLGATRWFNLGPFGSLQPAEILKFGLMLYMANFIGTKMKQKKVNDFNDTILPVAIILAVSMFFVIVLQKDLGTGLSLVSIAATIMYMSGLSRKNIVIASIVLSVLGIMFIVTSPHRVERVMTYLKGDDAANISDSGNYHIEHAKIAIGTGGLFGMGIGNSIQATGYLPEAINDSVFAIMGETFGYVGLIIVLLLFSALLLRLLKISDHLVDNRQKLVVAGVFGWLASHVILNIASMIGVFPLTGITLPLLSSGGTSILFIASALGLAFNLSGLTVHSSKLKEINRNENIDGRRGIGRSRNASSGRY